MSIHSGGLYVNQRRVTDPARVLVRGEHVLDNGVTLLRVGQFRQESVSSAKSRSFSPKVSHFGPESVSFAQSRSVPPRLVPRHLNGI